MVFRRWLARLREPAPQKPKVLTKVVEHLGPHCTTVVDVGARDGLEQMWYNIAPLARLVGFEPDADECQALNQRASSSNVDVRYVPLALGETVGRAPLYRTKNPACSSL